MLRRLQRYLDPFVSFQSITREAGALEYNRRHRGILLTYVKRWIMIGLACATLMEPLGAAARMEPLLCLPIVGLELGLSAAVCATLLSLAVYFVLGLEP